MNALTNLPMIAYTVTVLGGMLAVALPAILTLRLLQRGGSPLGVTRDRWLTAPRLGICTAVLGSISVQTTMLLLGYSPWEAIALALIMGGGIAVALIEISGVHESTTST